jgi:hypothetical protein
MKPSLYTLLALCYLALLLLLCPVQPATATVGPGEEARKGGGAASLAEMPKQCRPGKTSPEALGWRWRPETSVRVYYLKGSFDGTERAALTRAVEGWNNALREIGAGVVFKVSGERESVSTEGASVTVLRGEPRKQERLGELRFYLLTNGSMRAVMTIRPVVKDADALTSMMTHELGHSLGLADCYGCKRGTTAMSAFRDDNRGNDVYEPSVCDKYVVAAGYAGQLLAESR